MPQLFGAAAPAWPPGHRGEDSEKWRSAARDWSRLARQLLAALIKAATACFCKPSDKNGIRGTAATAYAARHTWRPRILPLLCLLLLPLLWLYRRRLHPYLAAVREPIAYVTRPLLEPSTSSVQPLSFYGLSGVVRDEDEASWADITKVTDAQREDICGSYGWNARSPAQLSADRSPTAAAASSIPRLVYLVMYNGELDLLLLLLRTVGQALDLLVISEVPVTHSGVPKRMLLNETLTLQAHTLRPWAERILYVPLPGDIFDHTSSSFFRETSQRDAMLGSAVRSGHVRVGDLVMEGDVDEIPRRSALWLLQLCALPDAALPLSLALRKYYYSFEWMTLTYWTPLKVTRLSAAAVAMVRQTHGERRQQQLLLQPGGDSAAIALFNSRQVAAAAQLADAGWHCSWCFETLAEFAQKTASYSHVEHDDDGLRRPDWLQRAVCEGRDLAGRWGEYHTWADMLRHLPGEFVRQRSVVGLPPALLQHRQQYAYLLPGRCMRRDYRGEFTPPP